LISSRLPTRLSVTRHCEPSRPSPSTFLHSGPLPLRLLPLNHTNRLASPSHGAKQKISPTSQPARKPCADRKRNRDPPDRVVVPNKKSNEDMSSHAMPRYAPFCAVHAASCRAVPCRAECRLSVPIHEQASSSVVVLLSFMALPT
jgi:hypothetical protein